MHRSGWRFYRKVIKDAQILLTSLAFVCIPSFHCRVNVLITFGTFLVKSPTSKLWQCWRLAVTWLITVHNMLLSSSPRPEVVMYSSATASFHRLPISLFHSMLHNLRTSISVVKCTLHWCCSQIQFLLSQWLFNNADSTAEVFLAKNVVGNCSRMLSRYRSGRRRSWPHFKVLYLYMTGQTSRI